MLETNKHSDWVHHQFSESSLLSIVVMEGCAVLSCAHPLPESALAGGRRSTRSRRTRVSSSSHSISHGCRFITTKVSHNPQISLSFRTISSIPKSKNLNVKQFQCGSSSLSNSNNGFIRTAATSSSDDDDECDFIVVNFYRFVYIENPEDEVSKHLTFLQGFNIHGRIYINEQGINAQFSGPSKDSMKYVEWIKKDPKFSDVLVQISPTFNGNHAFPRLKLRYKPSLVQYEGGISHLPLLESSNRAIPLMPNQWRERLLRVSSNDDRSFILLDVRNGYEWDVGHFDGAQRPDVDCFRTTSFGLSQSEVKIAAEANDPLSGVDKDRTDILMYCTGGIRCDVYSTILRQRGYRNLYTLKGGVSHYLEREGSFGWIGNLFVFDARLSLPPSAYKPEISSSKDEGGSESKKVASNFGRCYICGLQRLDELRHRNCANLDCNLLFLCCNDCVKELRGCCCLNCTSASRLRPVLPGHQRYEKWHIYRDSELRRDSVA